jgi:hypothetical protein
MTRLETPSTTCEPMKCFSKVLDGPPITCGSRIGKRPDVVFRVSFSTVISTTNLHGVYGCKGNDSGIYSDGVKVGTEAGIPH